MGLEFLRAYRLYLYVAFTLDRFSFVHLETTQSGALRVFSFMSFAQLFSLSESFVDFLIHNCHFLIYFAKNLLGGKRGLIFASKFVQKKSIFMQMISYWLSDKFSDLGLHWQVRIY